MGNWNNCYGDRIGEPNGCGYSDDAARVHKANIIYPITQEYNHNHKDDILLYSIDTYTAYLIISK